MSRVIIKLTTGKTVKLESSNIDDSYLVYLEIDDMIQQSLLDEQSHVIIFEDNDTLITSRNIDRINTDDIKEYYIEEDEEEVE